MAATATQPRTGAVPGSHVVLLAVAAISPASSAFIVLLPLAAGDLGPGSLNALVLGIGLAMLLAATYAAVSRAAPVNGGEPAMVGRILGPTWGGAAFSATLVAVVVIVGLFLKNAVTFLAPQSHQPWVILGAAVVLISLAALTFTVAVWVSFTVLLVELAALGAATWVILSDSTAGPGEWVTSCASSAGDVSFSAVLLAVPVVLFGLNGYQQPIYLTEEVRGGAAKVRKLIFVALALTILIEGIPFVAMACGTNGTGGTDADSAKLGDVLGKASDAWLTDPVGLAIVAAILNAVLAILIFGSRLVTSFARSMRDLSPVGSLPSGTAPPVSRRGVIVSVVLLGVSATAVALWVEPATIFIIVGSMLIFKYFSVACCALIVARRDPRGPRSGLTALAVAVMAVLGVLAAQKVADERQSVVVCVGVAIGGAVATWAWMQWRASRQVDAE